MLLHKQVKLGIQRHPIKVVASVAVSYVLLWELIEPAASMLGLTVAGTGKYVALVLARLVVGLGRALPRASVSCRIGSTNTRLAPFLAILMMVPAAGCTPAPRPPEDSEKSSANSAAANDSLMARIFPRPPGRYALAVNPAGQIIRLNTSTGEVVICGPGNKLCFTLLPGAVPP